jgi:large subunit ribosomal protein L25
MTSFNLKANLRKTLGSADSRRSRKSGQLPAVIYKKGSENLNIVVDSKDFEHQYLKGNVFTTVVEIELEGKKLQALARKIEFNPVTDKPEHVDFVQFEKKSLVKAQVKLNFINKDRSIGLKRGGFLHVVLRRVEVLCSPDSIPQTIEIDTASLKVGSKVRSQDLQLPEGVKIAKKDNFIIASIIGRGSKDDDKAEAVADGAAAPAADAKAAPASATKAPAAAAKPAAKK